MDALEHESDVQLDLDNRKLKLNNILISSVFIQLNALILLSSDNKCVEMYLKKVSILDAPHTQSLKSH